MQYYVGKRVAGVINNITDLGVFVTLPDHKRGLVHHTDFGNNWLRERRNYRIGQNIRVVIVHNYKGRLGLSIKRLNDPELVDPKNQFAQTKPEDFLQVLNNVAQESKKEIKQLEKVLIDR